MGKWFTKHYGKLKNLRLSNNTTNEQRKKKLEKKVVGVLCSALFCSALLCSALLGLASSWKRGPESQPNELPLEASRELEKAG
ncbi:hypothetical protein M0804_002855 [Polistes exclamans]|nr:hypothetical protein M0804_002855 [Polistes exclamans]